MAYQGGRLADGTPLNVAVYRAYRNAGLTHSQALAITAEVGRENGFNPNTAFGTHPDPAKDSQGRTIRNVGMLSWNQGRDTQVLNYLSRAGVLGQHSQANLNAQAAFSVNEMRGAYRSKLQNFWNNPNANPESFARELGKNYVVWAYGQNSIRGKVPGTRVPFNWQSHDARRRGYLTTLMGMAGGQQFNTMPQGGYQNQYDARPGLINVKQLMQQQRPALINIKQLQPTVERPATIPVAALQAERPATIPVSQLMPQSTPQVTAQPLLQPIAQAASPVLEQPMQTMKAMQAMQAMQAGQTITSPIVDLHPIGDDGRPKAINIAELQKNGLSVT